MDFFGDYEINSKSTTRQTQTLPTRSTELKPTSSTEFQPTMTTIEEVAKAMIPLSEKEKEILIFSLCGIIFAMTIAFIVYIVRARKRRTAIDFELERLTAGSSTTLFDTKNR